MCIHRELQGAVINSGWVEVDLRARTKTAITGILNGTQTLDIGSTAESSDALAGQAANGNFLSSIHPC